MTPVSEAVEQLSALAESWSDAELSGVKLPGNTANIWSARIRTILAEVARLTEQVQVATEGLVRIVAGERQTDAPARVIARETLTRMNQEKTDAV